MQLALNPQTQGIIGAREFALMKPDALFINTARGKLVDQAALTEALAQGQIGAVALDVFADEPLPPDDPLLLCTMTRTSGLPSPRTTPGKAPGPGCATRRNSGSTCAARCAASRSSI